MTLWLEPGAESGTEWRWRVCRVQTGKEAYFTRLTDVLAFVARESGAAVPRLDISPERAKSREVATEGA